MGQDTNRGFGYPSRAKSRALTIGSAATFDLWGLCLEARFPNDREASRGRARKALGCNLGDDCEKGLQYRKGQDSNLRHKNEPI